MNPNHIFCFHTLIKKNNKKSIDKTLTNDPQNRENRVPKWLKNKDSQKAAPKEHKITKNDQKCAKMGSPTEGYRSHFFVIFEHWGTPGHPHGPQSFQKRSKEASKRQFGIIFAPIFTHFRPFVANFSEHFGFDFHMFSTAPNKQTHTHTYTRTHTQQRTQQKRHS